MVMLQIDLYTLLTTQILQVRSRILEAALRRGLDGIALTDHSTVDSFTEASALAFDLLIVPSIEIETDECHHIGFRRK